MRLTKYSHSCIRLDDGERSLVLDPGVYSEAATALAGAAAVLITHAHPDHVDQDALRAAAQANPNLRVWGADGVAVDGVDITTVDAGQTLDAGGFAVRTFGGQHALIHPAVPIIANVGYLVEDSVYHPGDSFTVPPVPVSTLLLPIHAPWSKIAEVVDFAVSVRAPQAFPIHDALLNENGRGVVEGNLSRLLGPYGVEYRHLDPTETVEV